MFTGIIESVGRIARIAPEGQGSRLEIQCDLPLAEVVLGDSIAVNGACLTVTRLDGDRFEVIAARETLACTNLGDLVVGASVHLERARKIGDRLDGHWVQGHVDALGRVTVRDPQGESLVLWVDVGAEFARYVVPKGSICIDGVSLTINEIEGTRARVNLIPHTVEVTRLGALRVGDSVNIEVDILAKYLESLMRPLVDSGLTLDKLKLHGFA